ncbi:AraC family transcriptional regulator [Olivibacter sitiensis]|uniref:AraC family transcriptional regulator n=1 Tax=Olivibacter sitiensis TaxID=376470 RepID=UPI0003F735A6|nr:AraC family transcriptional regulator [Olivibacter sitiensis]
MKPQFHKVPVPPQTSFSVRHDIQQNFGNIWHYHPELELHYVIRGRGVKFIGDNISNFAHGEILLLGSNLPHMWRCNEEYFDEDAAHEIEAIVVHFSPYFLGKDFLNLPETYLLTKLFEKARKGMVFQGDTREKLARLMHGLPQANDLDRIIRFLSILRLLSETEEYVPLASAHAFYQSNELDIIRLNKICNYTLQHYKKEISLQEIASISNLSITSFCRYFKLMTNKTYYDFLIEIRISHACRMLVEDKLPIDMICFECGFNNVSNFYRHFKKVTAITPRDYKMKYLDLAVS